VSKWAVIPFLLLAASCHTISGDPMLAPVRDEAAPTAGQLFARGYVVVDFRPVGFDCGPACIGDGFDAVYLGLETDVDQPDLAHYACPGMPRTSLDDWKCRPLRPPYVPNGGDRR